jgi:hypothetical protein
LLENAGVFTYDRSLLNSYIAEDVMPDFYDGSISAEKAAEMIYDQVNYMYFE